MVLEWDEQFLACKHGDYAAAWVHLERAHVLAQKMPLLRTLSHLKMLKLALYQRDVQEVLAQMNRLVLVWTGCLLGSLLTGNVGSSRVGPFEKIDIPEDLQKILDKTWCSDGK